MNNFFKNFFEIAQQLLLTGWERVRSVLTRAAGRGSSPESSLPKTEGKHLNSATRRSLRMARLLIFGVGISLSGMLIWKVLPQQPRAASDLSVDWLAEYQALLVKADRNELPISSNMAFSGSETDHPLPHRLREHLRARVLFAQRLSFPSSVAIFLPGESVLGFSAQEKNLYVDALLDEWRGFLFAGDIDSADAYASQFRSDSQFLGLSADQQLQAATLDLRTTLISGKAVSRERQEEFAKDIEKSTQTSMNASADIAQLTLIEAYVRDGRVSDANDRLDRVMARVQADHVTSGSPAGIVPRLLADTAMLVGRFADSRAALQGYQKAQDELPMCHDHLEYWLSQAELTLNEGLVRQAEFSISKAARCFEFKKTRDHFQFARMKNIEGLIHVLMERPTEALTAFDVAASIWRKRLGEQHFWIGQAYNNKGAALRGKGDLPLAGQEFEKSASLWRDVLGESHPVMATFYNNIAELEMRQGGLEKAQKTFSKAYSLRRQAFGDDHPWTAVVISNMGEVASLAGAYEQALEWHVKALSIRKKTLGNVHPDTALSQNNLGSILLRTGETQRAFSAFREALTINQKLLGEAHPRTMAVQANLAASQIALEDYAGADGTLVRLAELETIRGVQARPSLAMVLVMLGDVRLKLGLLQEAEVVYLAALDTMNQMEGEWRSPDVARKALTGLGSVQNQFGKARAREKVESQYPWLRDVR